MNSPRQTVLTKLRQDGWSQVRQNGSHLIFKKPGNVNTISVPQDSRGFGVRVYKKILSELRNGSKFERRELKGGISMSLQQPQPLEQQAAELQRFMKPTHIPVATVPAPKKVEAEAEQWKPFPGFPDYEVSSEGRVNRVYRTATTGVGIRTRLAFPEPVALWNTEQRPIVRVSNGDKKSTLSVMVVVAAAFLPKPPSGVVATPKNGNLSDCRLANIKFVEMSDLIRGGQAKRPQQ